MKIKLTIAALVILAGSAIAFIRFTPGAAQSGSVEAVPQFTVSSLEHSFGTVKPGTPLRHAFIVEKHGSGFLEIKEVRPSCGCTTTNFDKSIAPGKTGQIALAIEKTDTYNGELAKSAIVATNDPKNASVTLVLKANFVK